LGSEAGFVIFTSSPDGSMTKKPFSMAPTIAYSAKGGKWGILVKYNKILHPKGGFGGLN
jgi:hypothetical protein